MLVQAFGILCGLALAVFSSTGIRGLFGIGIFAVSFAATILLVSPDRFPDPVWVAASIGGLSWLILWKPRLWLVAATTSGFAGGVWLRLLEAEGLPLFMAAVVVLAIAAATAVLSKRQSHFAPAPLRDEAVLLVGVYSVVLAASPSVYAGYESAIALTAVPLAAPDSVPAPWALGVAVGFLFVGGAWALWKHR